MSETPSRRSTQSTRAELGGRSDARSRLPQPIPYQGSKRWLGPVLVEMLSARKVRRAYEPFAGSAAVSIALAAARIGKRHVIGDDDVALIELWRAILEAPERLSDEYCALWEEQQRGDPAAVFARARNEFNARAEPSKLLFLLARCVKNSPRFNRSGQFNQSPDHRRLGRRPSRMAAEIARASAILCPSARLASGGFRDTTRDAGSEDFVYLDPPYEGVSTSRDARYRRGLKRDDLVIALDDLIARDVPFALSYDGSCGSRTYGDPLPRSLSLVHAEITVGRSSQATLHGTVAYTTESLYLSRHFSRVRLICATAVSVGTESSRSNSDTRA